MTEYAYSSSDLDHSSTEKIQYVIWADLQSLWMEMWLTNKALLVCDFPNVFDEPKVYLLDFCVLVCYWDVWKFLC